MLNNNLFEWKFQIWLILLSKCSLLTFVCIKISKIRWHTGSFPRNSTTCLQTLIKWYMTVKNEIGGSNPFWSQKPPSQTKHWLAFFDLELFISLTFKSTDGTFYMRMRLEATRHQKRHTVTVKNFHLNTREVWMRKLDSSHYILFKMKENAIT